MDYENEVGVVEAIEYGVIDGWSLIMEQSRWRREEKIYSRES